MEKTSFRNEVRYDLNERNEYCDGRLAFRDGAIVTLVAGESERVYPLDGAEEVVQRTYSGCASLEIVPKGHAEDFSDSVPVCRFSMSCLNEIGELCKVVNHYLTTGETTEISADAARVCPKCGRAYARGMDVCLFCVDRGYVIRHTFELVRPFAGRLALAGTLVSLSSVFSALAPVFNARLVDGYLNNTALSFDEAKRGVLVCVAIICALQVLASVFGILGQRQANRMSCSLSDNLRKRVYDKIQRLSMTSMSGRKTGDLMKRVTRDTETVRNFITEQGVYAIQKIISFVAVLVILACISPWLTFLVFVPIPVVVFAIYRFWSTIHVRYERQWRCESRVNSSLHDIVKGIRVIKAFGTEKREVEKFDSLCRRLFVVSKKNEQFWALVFPYLTFLMGAGEFLVLYFGGRAVVNGDMTVGQLLEFTLFLAYIYQPLRWMSSLPRRFGEFTTSLIKIFEIIDEKPETAPLADDSVDFVPGDVTLDRVTFGYKPYEIVLKEASFTVPQGSMVGLVGHSGAGKSTLINLILRLYENDSGTIMINGTDVKKIPMERYRAHTAAVFQETFLFAGTVYDNIAYARPDAEESEIIAAARAANAHGFIMDLPDGYNTVVGENGHNLSGGERQRLAIARAVLRNPDLLILDEATSALDPETEKSVQDALAKLVRGRTTFVIAHRLATLKNADSLIVIEKGRVAETGTHEELLRRDGIYAALVRAQRGTASIEHVS